MLFERRLQEGLEDGTITVVFRRWKRRQVVPGGRYRTGTGRVEARSVTVVDPAAIDAADAAAAGYPSADAVRADLRGAPGDPVFRIEFQPCAEGDPRTLLGERATLATDARADLDARLARLAARWATPPSPVEILRQIGTRPGVVSAVLAADAHCERPEYKRRVRALKELGLTLSEDVGYRLSPRGQAYLGGG